MNVQTNNDQETRELGKQSARNFLEAEKNRKQALVISLEGELGAGKTTFTQGFAQAVGATSWIKSPTFVLMREHVIKNAQKKQLKSLIHIDCYRLKDPEALLELDIKKILADPQNVVLVEWGKRLKELLPLNTIRIKFQHINEHTRKITIN
jgi:tRNA threonylcarbamoyladenosine biosynthesis protein TsaE